jgi:hypothetical protein
MTSPVDERPKLTSGLCAAAISAKQIGTDVE